MKKFRYMRINSKHIPDEVMTEYDLHDKLHDNYIYVKIRKGMYGLKEAGIIAFQRLVKNLAPMDTGPCATHLACGDTIPYPLHLL